LLGVPGECDERARAAAVYERALQAYFGRDFATAVALLEPLNADRPSQVLLARCQTMLVHPPSDAWDGVYVATTK